MKKRGFSIGRRLAVGLFAILAITTGAAGYSIWCLNDLEQGYKKLTDDSMAQERNAQEWINILTLSGARNLVGAKFGDLAATQKVFTAFDLADSASLRARVGELQKDIFGHLTTAEGKQLVDVSMAKRKVYLERLDATVAMIKDGKKEEAQKKAEEEVLPALKAYIGSTQTLLKHTRVQIAKEQVDMQAESARARAWVIALTTAALCVATAIGWLLTRSITIPLGQAVRIAEKVASGDLRSEIVVGRMDETGALLTAIGTMQNNLKELIGNVQRDIGNVSASASQLAVAAN